MKKLLTFLLLVFIFSCSQEDPATKPVNHFINTSWEGKSADGMLTMSFTFINETECKLIIDLPLFPPTTNFLDYTYKDYTAELIDKSTHEKAGWVCTINGSTMSVQGRNEVFKRTN